MPWPQKLRKRLHQLKLWPLAFSNLWPNHFEQDLEQEIQSHFELTRCGRNRAASAGVPPNISKASYDQLFSGRN
jgi:hypothetical protein